MKIMHSLVSWKSFHRQNSQSHLRSLARAFFPSATAILTLLLSTASSSFAGRATWKASPANREWFNVNNWATRDHSSRSGRHGNVRVLQSNKHRYLAFDTELDGIVFNPGASAFTIATNPTAHPTITISGVGITNNSGIVQNFVLTMAARRWSSLTVRPREV